MSLKIKDFAEAFHVKDVTTTRMQKAIDDWYKLYFDEGSEEKEDNCQRLAYTVVSKIYKAAFSEYEAESDNEFAQSVIDGANAKRKKAMQQALIGGQSWLKPVIGETPKFTVVTRDNVIILGRDIENNVVDIGTEEDSEQNGKYYTLFERRYINEGGTLTIETKLYESTDREDKGKEVPLDRLERYKDIEPKFDLPIDNIGLIPVICPAENCVDGSDDPVSVYAAAVGLIHNINHNEWQLNTEFDNGESRIMVSSDLMRGKNRLTDNVFTALDDDPESIGIQPFTPPFRDASFINRKHEYLRNIESIIGLKRGLLSDVEAQEKTATEITSSAGEYNLTVIDFQQMWETALRACVQLCCELWGIYRLGNNTVADEDVVANWGNGVLYDRDKTFGEYLTMVQSGMLKPEIALAFYFNLDWTDANDLAKIKEEYMPDLQAMMEEANA